MPATTCRSPTRRASPRATTLLREVRTSLLKHVARARPDIEDRLEAERDLDWTVVLNSGD
jgi:hypothetical protein